MNRHARNAGLALAITGVALIACVHAAAELALSTRHGVEAWQARRAYSTGLFPRDWHWPGLPR